MSLPAHGDRLALPKKCSAPHIKDKWTEDEVFGHAQRIVGFVKFRNISARDSGLFGVRPTNVSASIHIPNRRFP